MAGIGFELKKLFRRKGIFAGAYAYGYASVVCCGPMLLGILLLLGVGTIAKASGAALHERQLLNGMITVTLLAGLTVSSFLSLLVTRYLADMLFENKNGRIMPAFWGSTGLLLIFGGLGYGIFLCFAGLTFLEALLCFLLFGEIVTVWTEISFLTAVKDYKCILLAFAAALAVGLLLGVLLVLVLGQPVLSSLMAAMIVSYGIMTVWYLWVLLGYFPENEGSSFAFLAWADRYPTLAWNGLFTNAGLFAHLVLMWIGPYGQKIQGLFFFEPDYDLAAVFAFLSILITTVNFVVSVEVNFYPRYRDYYALFNDRGTIRDIDVACEDMCSVLSRELLYASVRQAFCTFLFLVFGSVLFKRYPLGFTDESLGIFRVLCIGYGLYAIANMFMLALLYFSDNIGAFASSAVFCAATIGFTIASFWLPSFVRGLGFCLGALCFLVVAWLRLEYITNTLEYHLLCVQPLVEREKKGVFTRLSHLGEKAAGREQKT